MKFKPKKSIQNSNFWKSQWYSFLFEKWRHSLGLEGERTGDLSIISRRQKMSNVLFCSHPLQNTKPCLSNLSASSQTLHLNFTITYHCVAFLIDHFLPLFYSSNGIPTYSLTSRIYHPWKESTFYAPRNKITFGKFPPPVPPLDWLHNFHRFISDLISFKMLLVGKLLVFELLLVGFLLVIQIFWKFISCHFISDHHFF